MFQNKVTAIPATVSLGLKVILSEDFYFYPKIGLGYMYLSTSSEGRGSGSSSAILLKPAMELTYKLSHRFLVHLEMPLTIAQDLGGTGLGKELNYYFIPNLGVSYRF